MCFPLGAVIGTVIVGLVYDRLAYRWRSTMMAVLSFGAVAAAAFLMVLSPSATIVQRQLCLAMLGFCSSPVYYIAQSVYATLIGGAYVGSLLVLIDAFG